MTFLSAPAPGAPPLTPDAPVARQWLLDELAHAQYQAARPTWFDLASEAVKNWFASLFSATGHGQNGFVPVALTVLFITLLVVAFLTFGRPRLNRRSKAAGSIVDPGDARDSNDLRTSAATAAANGDWALAIEELFRAMAKNMSERSILSLSPGTTARDFSVRASAVFAEHQPALIAAASSFDRVRYLGMDGTREAYTAMSELERSLRSKRPASLESVDDFAMPR